MSAVAQRPAAGVGREPTGRVPVLYVGGSGRSGSTLLERVIGQLPDVFPLGEVVFLWRRGVLEDQLCGCGERFSACPFWTAVGARAFGGWGSIELDEVLELQREVDRNRFIPLMLAGAAAPASYRRRLSRYRRYVVAAYRAALAESGANVLVDSSKHASTAFLLARLSELEVRVVHLVRDSRGVAYSWTKQVRKPEVVGGDSYMPRYHPGRQSLYWTAYNAMFEALPMSRVDGVMRLRYESLLRDPRAEVERVARFAGVATTGEAFSYLNDRTVDLAANHTVSGNPMRFKTGRLELRMDDAWRRELPRRQAALVSAVTWPLQRRYGYR
jgi:DNA-directed RNA polymerase subunit K/omega